MNKLTEVDFIDLKSLRDSNLERVDVLDRVGTLALMPSTELAVTQQVADFYKVPKQTINSLIFDNKEELNESGLRDMTGIDLADSCGDKAIVLRKRGHMLINEVKVAFTINKVFTKRAILLVGMLLKDSEVAKQVRTFLLDVEQIAEEIAPEVIEAATIPMAVERELKADLADAIMNGDVIAAAEIMRHIKSHEQDTASRRITALTEENVALIADNQNLMSQYEICADEKESFKTKVDYVCQRTDKKAERRALCLSIIEAYGESQFGSLKQGYYQVYETLRKDYGITLAPRITANPKKAKIDLLTHSELMLLEMLLRKLVVTHNLEEFYA